MTLTKGEKKFIREHGFSRATDLNDLMRFDKPLYHRDRRVLELTGNLEWYDLDITQTDGVYAMETERNKSPFAIYANLDEAIQQYLDAHFLEAENVRGKVYKPAYRKLE